MADLFGYRLRAQLAPRQEEDPRGETLMQRGNDGFKFFQRAPQYPLV